MCLLRYLVQFPRSEPHQPEQVVQDCVQLDFKYIQQMEAPQSLWATCGSA